MIVAIAKNNGFVHEFFGSCNEFVLVHIEDGKVVSTQEIFNDVETHKLRPNYLKRLGVNVLVIKGLGLTAYELLKENGIELYTSEPILIDEAIQAYICNDLKLMDVPAGAHC